jgi:hypothetical protein
MSMRNSAATVILNKITYGLRRMLNHMISIAPG